VTNAIAELIDQDEPEVVVSTNAESINSSTAEREKEQLREVDLAFSKKNLFQETEFKDNGIIIDSNNVFLSFIYHLERIKHEHGENHVPKYYLVEIFDRIYEYLTALGFGPIIFYTDPDFYIYLLPEPEKTQKLSKFSPELREKYKLYSGSREENKFFNLKLSTSCFNHTKRGDDTDMLILEHASTHQYKILSNDNFDEVEYAKYRDFISRNKYTFTIVYGEITFKDEMGAELGDQLTLLELPKGKSKGMPSQTKERIKKSILHELSKQELNPFELKKKIKGKSTYIQEVIDELSRGKLISRMDDLNWSLNKSKNTSILEIVFGAFHSKIGGILIYPKCVACGKENCNCALPRTDIPRTKARVHVQKALDTEGMQFISNDDTYIARRWTYKTDFGLRKELIWAILVFLDPNSTKYNLEKDFLQEFIKDYEFKVEDVLDELVGEGLRGLELEVHFYGKLYEKIEEFVSDCWTYLTQNVKY
jgi:hypothetical protein